MATARMEPTPLVQENGVAEKNAKWRDLQRDVEDRATAVANAEMWADPDAPDGMDAEEEGPPDADVLGPCDVRLSDGRIATLRRTRGIHDLRMGKFLSRIGYTVQVLGADAYGEVKACLCLEAIRRAGESPEKARPQKTPTSQAELDFAMGQFLTRDLITLALAYARINLGLVPDGQDDGGEPDLSS